MPQNALMGAQHQVAVLVKANTSLSYSHADLICKVPGHMPTHWEDKEISTEPSSEVVLTAEQVKQVTNDFSAQATELEVV
ncbi:hypothetical protein GYMLUDRAFT_245662 [Collybiopsis luxurians FD-317 M1]|uniref:Uncharacterized protein n=1 Tax=Collybiopsis luxurians FD-317 M1 TaxID=944289 RepID=A0A0D0C8S4_9AGAR|nr:hypothetical protein GYMLUDRAFT_245662 [Collybiopsis luxurians FD-317 M1]